MHGRQTCSEEPRSQAALLGRLVVVFAASFGVLLIAFYLEHGRLELAYLAVVAAVPATLAAGLSNTSIERQSLGLFALGLAALFLLPSVGESSVGMLGTAHRLGILLALGAVIAIELLRRAFQPTHAALGQILRAGTPLVVLAASVKLIMTANVRPTEPVRIEGVDHAFCVAGTEANGRTTPGVFCTSDLAHCEKLREQFSSDLEQRRVPVSLSECAESQQEVYCAHNPSTGTFICGHDRDGCKNKTLFVAERLGPCYLTAFATSP